MSLLLTRHVDQYRINVLRGGHGVFRPYHVCAGRLEPFADQLTVKIIMLDDQHPFHRQPPR